MSRYGSKRTTSSNDPRKFCESCGAEMTADASQGFPVKWSHADGTKLCDGAWGGKTYDHKPRPDDTPEDGDRCKYCGEDITWLGPSTEYDWLHVDDVENQ